MQVTERAKLVADLGLTGFSGTGSLAKQRLRINELINLGSCRRVEGCILKSVLPDIVESEYANVVLHSTAGSLCASYRLGEMTMSQVFKTPLQAKNWLLSMSQQHKSGTLTKNPRGSASSCKRHRCFGESSS